MLGASGYTGEEVVRLLALHPSFKATALTGESQAGKVCQQAVVWFAEGCAPWSPPEGLLPARSLYRQRSECCMANRPAADVSTPSEHVVPVPVRAPGLPRLQSLDYMLLYTLQPDMPCSLACLQPLAEV